MKEKVPDINEADKKRNILLFGVLALAGLLLVAVAIVGLLERAEPKTAANKPQPTAKASLSAGRATELGLPNGYTAKVFSSDVPKARDLAFSPGGTLLVSLHGSNKVVALPDKNQDGVADSAKEVASGNIPHGLAFSGQYLFVAELERVARYKWDEATLTATFDKQLFNLPSSGGGHYSRTLAVYPNGKLFVSVGSTCNVCAEKHDFIAAVLESNINGENPRVFISGTRNSSFLAVNPNTNELWATENSRDNLGDNIPPDEINILRSGKHYGWPYCYGDAVRDTTFDSASAFDCAATVAPAYKVQAHSAPLGLTFVSSSQFPADWQGDLLVSFHGSWNRSEPTGYKVVKLNVEGDKISNQEDFITFKSGGLGRPVDVIFDKLGNLYVSDDKAGAVYIVQRL